MPMNTILLAYEPKGGKYGGYDETYELGLFDHGRKHQLRATNALIECAPIELHPLPILLWHLAAV
jgi:hypothetical protein